MLGFAVIDAPTDAGYGAVWLTSRMDTAQADHTNAAVFDTTASEDRARMQTMLVDRYVLASPATDVGMLEGATVLPPDAIRRLEEEAADLESLVLDAIAEHNRRHKSNLISPVFHQGPPSQLNVDMVRDEARGAFELAHELRHHWNRWLAADEQRRRRVTQPRTGTSPWLIPGDTNAALRQYPPDLIEGLAR